jgi:hypothetical protein
VALRLLGQTPCSWAALLRLGPQCAAASISNPAMNRTGWHWPPFADG